jgi:hypothetical protein
MTNYAIYLNNKQIGSIYKTGSFNYIDGQAGYGWRTLTQQGKGDHNSFEKAKKAFFKQTKFNPIEIEIKEIA